MLEKLFGDTGKVKLMKLFLLNPDLTLANKEVVKRVRLAGPAVARGLKLLHQIGLLKRVKGGGGKRWQLDRTFPFIPPLRVILRDDLTTKRKELVQLFGQCGKLNLLISSGVFIDNADSRVDLLIVGDALKRAAIDRTVAQLEAEMGRELSYSVMATEDFAYRYSTSDKFVRDVLDYPHDLLINRTGLLT